MPAQAAKSLDPILPQDQPSSDSDSACLPNRFNDSPADSLAQSKKTFRSILFVSEDADISVDARTEPEIFSDLLLDQVVASITTGRDEYNLKHFFYTPLGTVEAVYYRYDVLRDLEHQELCSAVESFAHSMCNMRSCVQKMEKLYYKRQKESWFLDAVEIYCEAVRKLSHDLAEARLRSAGFLGLQAFLASYLQSADFITLATETRKIRAQLKQVAYSIHIKGRRITATKNETSPDYGAEVLQTFQKFSQGATKAYNFEFHAYPEMNHIESSILDMVAQIYPETFFFLEEYSTRHGGFLNTMIKRFDREVQFYLACMEHIRRLAGAGCAFCHPVVSDQSKTVAARDVFDIALAEKLLHEERSPVTNHFYLTGPERIFIVSGPNQGGKTTFARTFGQLHYLASIGCPIPASSARLFLFDRLFTHFEEEESIANLSGKLENELVRIHRILECATSNSILIMNESFLSTTLDDALFLSRKILDKIVALDMLCVSVTFLDELATFCNATVSMVSTIHPADPALRTFKVVRKAADGLAYAVAIAEKYRLTHDKVKARIIRNKKGSVSL